jgi:peptide/nickel transport system substrate-binding protein
VTDASEGVAEIEGGASGDMREIPHDQGARPSALPGLAGTTKPVSDIGPILLDGVGPMTDPNRRKAAATAIDEEPIVDRLPRGQRIPIHTVQTPEYAAPARPSRSPAAPSGRWPRSPRSD